MCLLKKVGHHHLVGFDCAKLVVLTTGVCMSKQIAPNTLWPASEGFPPLRGASYQLLCAG